MISAWWHMVGVVFIVGILIIVPDNHQSLSYVFTKTINNSGFGDGTTSLRARVLLVSGSACCSPQYTITGFDASAHTAEETNNASRMAATGMWTSVVVSVIFGWILLWRSRSRSRAPRGRSTRSTPSGFSCPGSGRSR